MGRPYRYINMDHGPNTCGSGDAIVCKWAIEGTKGTEEEFRLRSDNKKEILQLLGEENCPRPIGLSPKQIFGIEKACRANIPRVDQIRKLFDIKAEPKRPKLVIPQEARDYAELWWSDQVGLGKKLLTCEEVNDKSRRWPHFDEFVHIAFEEFAICELRKNDCDESWFNAAAIIDMADVVVAIDSAYAHIAATLGKKTIVIMGPTRPTAYAHATDCVTCLTPPEDDPCSGCVYNEPFHERKCGHFGCAQIAKITPRQVFEEVKRILK